ncbi:hypothetical protein E4631_25435 [Hymenobacter sp. UV11]|uniref:hypothetical protein n=1 Tax=Hymenobacter sp. UV11 TaxID=1849735 RepID=UPI00105F3A1A|nr:hypothetical protein [Hymenobacter sp. UV11]TDN38065.1 hypothetical protein A8B98_00565 [Hymenobacter sp. UV11]TFZ62234.1 hypothetical protein E4631_25435 [Hymenobacter sp. UV11]
MQELLDDIKALRRGIEALNKRSLEQGQPISRAEVNEVLAKVAKGTTFEIDYKGVAANIQPHLATPDTIAAAVATGSQQLKQVIDQIPRSMPLADKVWGFTSLYTWLVMMLIWVGFMGFTVYSWKQMGEAEEKTAQLQQQLTQKQATMKWLNDGYVDLKQDNPKVAKRYFPQ